MFVHFILCVMFVMFAVERKEKNLLIFTKSYEKEHETYIFAGACARIQCPAKRKKKNENTFRALVRRSMEDVWLAAKRLYCYYCWECYCYYRHWQVSWSHWCHICPIPLAATIVVGCAAFHSRDRVAVRHREQCDAKNQQHIPMGRPCEQTKKTSTPNDNRQSAS